MTNSMPRPDSPNDQLPDVQHPMGDVQLELALFDPKPLPNTLSSLQAFAGEVVQYLLAAEHGLIASTPSTRALVEYGEQRLPAAFHPDSIARGALIASIQYAEDAVGAVEIPEGGLTWPVSPILLADIVQDITTALVDSLAAAHIHLPGTVEYRCQRDLERIPMVQDNKGSGEAYHARTMFLDDPDSTREVQYCVNRFGDELFIYQRYRGNSQFSEVGQLPHKSVVSVIALLQRYRSAFKLAA